jgi:uncharacterized delta-60 repeat protein
MFLARATSDHGADTSFGDSETGAGSSVVDVSAPFAGQVDGGVNAMAIAPEGAIYLAGYGSDSEGNWATVLARFSPSGRLDPTFGTGGVRRIQLAAPGGFSVLEEIVLQPDGKIVAVADLFGGSEEGAPRILRYLPNGSLDPTFGNGGQLVVNPGGDIQLAAAAIQDGQLLIAGYRRDSSGDLGFVSRYLLNPLPDPPASAQGSGSGSTAAPPPGKGSLRFKGKGLKVDRKGHVAVPIACSSAGPCAGTVAIVAATGKLTGPRKKRAKILGQARYSLVADVSRALTLTLSKQARDRARSRSGLKARLAIEPSAAAPTLSALKLHR